MNPAAKRRTWSLVPPTIRCISRVTSALPERSVRLAKFSYNPPGAVCLIRFKFKAVEPNFLCGPKNDLWLKICNKAMPQRDADVCDAFLVVVT